MSASKHKVFISYHHDNDQYYKEELLRFNDEHDIFTDMSVDTGDIDENLDDKKIREIIRDDYLRDSKVTIVLVGTDTKKRKHVDWEIYSSMYDGKVNKKSGILVIQLPGVGESFTAAHGGKEKESLYADQENWCSVTTRSEYENRYPYLPNRIIDNLLDDEVRLSVTYWNAITAEKLRLLIDLTFIDRVRCQYDLSRDMRRSNS